MNLRSIFAKSGALAGLLSNHWPIVLLTCIAIFPLFADLGGDYLWSDEGDTAVLAKTILQEGIPKAWDGRTFTDADFGERVNKDLVMVSHPWLQYYITAASFLVFGESEFAARFPFALAGLCTIPLMYLLVTRLTGDRRAALSAAILLTLSLQFLLFSRQCRNYSLNMLLVAVLILLFFRLTSRRDCWWFAFTGILLFHSNPSGLAPLAALGALTLFYKPCAVYRRWFWTSSPLIAAFTVPWIFFARSGYQQNTTLIENWSRLLPRLTQFFIECASVTPIVGIVVLFVWVWIRHFREERERSKKKQKLTFSFGRRVSLSALSEGERTLILVAGLIFLSYASLIALTQSRGEIFSLGLRYATPVIPLMMALVGMLVSKASRDSQKVWIAIMLVLSVTKLGRITPWAFFEQERVYFDGSVFAALHKPQGWKNYIFRTALISFSRELWHENRGTVAHVVDFLKKNAAADDILITNYCWEPLYFYTGLRQGLKIIPGFPAYEAARRKGLPEYAFGVEGVRWIVWRWAWENYRGYSWQPLIEALQANGATLTKVATIPETTWENRPEIHFHRFPGGEYKYSWFPEEQEPDAEIFRVDWPGQNQPNTAN